MPFAEVSKEFGLNVGKKVASLDENMLCMTFQPL